MSRIFLLSGRLLFAGAVLSVAVAVTAQERPFVMTAAGTPGVPGLQDGPASSALFNRPTWLDIVPDDRPLAGRRGEIYVVDRVNNAIRKIANGEVSTYRPARSYYQPEEFHFDFGGPFGGGIAIETANGGCGAGPYDRGFFVSTTGAQQVVLAGFSGSLAARDDVSPLIGVPYAPGATDGRETVAQFHDPTGLARSANYGSASYESRAIYVADTGNHTIRRIRFMLSFEACPQARIIETFAGAAGETGSRDGAARDARFSSPRGIAAALDGSLYVADSGNHTIRRISPEGVVTTVAGEAGVPGSNDGPARSAHLNTPSGIDVDASGNVFISDTANHTIRMLTKEGELSTVAGTPGVAGFADGAASSAKFNGPVGLKVALDGTIYVADTSNNTIRRIVLQRTGEGPRFRAVRH